MIHFLRTGLDVNIDPVCLDLSRGVPHVPYTIRSGRDRGWDLGHSDPSLFELDNHFFNSECHERTFDSAFAE